MKDTSIPSNAPDTSGISSTSGIADVDTSSKQEQISLETKEIFIPHPNAAYISNTKLLNQLVQDQDEALRGLSEEVAPVDIKDISVDKDGRVVVTNQFFRETLLVKLGTISPEGVSVNIYK